ncbi:ABC-three component system middle component 8 [Hydromonas duriensis]|uniref:Uncharacterized protein n=1 Tax=Hydromonas duriensis TaxID=1527608 RepID=A0A4R6Y5C7_9BURK|nr:hypothetical protein DFR44_12217 [Hydromonas duriensis]
MLRPTKHNHPDQTVIHLCVILLKQIRKKRIIRYEELHELSKSKVKGGAFLFQDTLNLLFLLGLIEYHEKNDSVEYTGTK